MKRFLLLIPVALVAVIASLAPVSVSVSNGAHLSSNNASAVSMNVFCKSGVSGYTGDKQTAADFCKQYNSTPVDVSGVCGPDSIAVSIPIFASDGKCVPNDPASGGAIVWYTKQLIKLASGAVGSIILLMLLVAGIQYITAAGDPGRVKLAKTRITNSVIALFLFLMAFAILSFLIPGGIFS